MIEGTFDVVGARAAGLTPFVMDPFGLQRDNDYETITSLRDIVARIEG